jgi:hypothetical protein
MGAPFCTSQTSEAAMQWKHPTFLKARKLKNGRLHIKVMASVFWV